MLEGVEWGEYRLGDLFEKVVTTALRYKTSDLPSHSCGDYTLPALTAGIQNQGLNNYVPREGATILNNVITISANGANTGATFYQPHEFCVLQDAYAIRWVYSEQELSPQSYLFMTSAISAVVYGKYEWTNKAGWSRVKDETIQLPTRRGKIDFEFMEKFIAELNAYLSITGLNNYTLTPEEEQALADFEAGKTQWGAYRFDAIFDCIKQGRRLKKDDQKEGSIPFVMAGVSNTGVVGYISNPIVTFPSNSITIDIFGNTFYRSYSFGAGDDTGVYWREDNRYSKEQMLYFATSMGRSLEGKYSYGKKLRSSQSIDAIMMLPQGVKEKPDYEGMSLLISAVQKLVIKDVALYAERELHATQAVIAQG